MSGDDDQDNDLVWQIKKLRKEIRTQGWIILIVLALILHEMHGL